MVAQGEEPWRGGFEKLKAHPQSQLSYTMQGPFAEISRNPTIHQREFDQDANAAYQCAILWSITGDVAYAKKAAQIIDGWSTTLKKVGGRDAVLAAGLSPFKLINAAEILRYTNAGWPEPNIRQAGQMFAAVFVPVLYDFALFANGNWDTAAIKTLMAVAVFRDDRELFERALRYYVHGAGDGRLTYYIYESGQCQESGRDQAHTQLGLAHLGDASEIAWNQGLDLYSVAENRLLKGFEYTARFNLGEQVPFTPDLDRTGKYPHQQISVGGPLRPVYEQIFNHYVNRRGLAAPYVQRAAETLRPEGAAYGADHTGFGTILYFRLPEQAKENGSPVPPGGLVAEGSRDSVMLSWIPVRGAASYVVKRDGNVVSSNIETAAYHDTHVTAGRTYRYMVAAVNRAWVASSDSLAARATAGLPSSWSQRDIGQPAIPGNTQFDGECFTTEAAGSDSYHFTWAPMAGDGAMVVRFVPQVASAFARMGIMLRTSPAAESGSVSLLINPGLGGRPERQNWSVSLLSQTESSQPMILGSKTLASPIVGDGRLMQPCWLKLERSGDGFTGWISQDGQHWDQLAEGNVQLPAGLHAGLAVSSGIANVSTAVEFDHVSISTARRGGR